MTQFESAKIAPLLSMTDISFSYGASKAVLSSASLEVSKGSFTCVVGESGVGKTTLLKLLYGQLTPQHGEVQFSGIDLSTFDQTQLQKYRRICGLIFQDSFMIPDLSIRENISLPLHLNNTYNIDTKNRIYAFTEQLGIHGILEELPRNVSVGERQRAGIVRAIVAKPALIFADEPTGSLDLDNKIKCFYLLHQLTERGATVVCATHDFEIVHWAKPSTITIKSGKCFVS